MIKNILAFVGALTLGLIFGFFSYIGYQVFLEEKAIQNGKYSIETLKVELQDGMSKVLINGSLCDQSGDPQSKLCDDTRIESDKLMITIENTVKAIDKKCNKEITSNLLPLLAGIHIVLSKDLMNRWSNQISYADPEIEHALMGNLSDVLAFDFNEYCSTEKGMLTVPQNLDYSTPPDNNNSQ